METSLPIYHEEIELLNKPDVSLDNSVVVLEREYAVTSPKLQRPILKTKGVGHSQNSCTGFYLFDPSNRIGALAHILHLDNSTFYEKFQDVLADITAAGAQELIFDYVGKILVPSSIEGILASQRHLQENERLIRPVNHIPVIAIGLDTRDGQIFRPSSVLDLKSHPLDRPYGSNRYGPNGGEPQWSRAYPMEAPKELKSPEYYFLSLLYLSEVIIREFFAEKFQISACYVFFLQEKQSQRA